MSTADLQAYVSVRDTWSQRWDSDGRVRTLNQKSKTFTPEEWSAAVTYTKRATAAGTTLWYGILANPMFWCGAFVFGVLMTSLGSYSLFYNVTYYFCAEVLSYVFADQLPLKYFSSSEGGKMDPVTAAWRNAYRMFLPLLGAGLSKGKLALGYSLTALVAVAVVEGGKHAMFHANGGRVFADRTFLVDLAERRLALMGLSLPVNVDLVRVFLERSGPEQMDVEEELAKKTP